MAAITEEWLAEVVALVEALTGLPWEPTKLGNVPVKKSQRDSVV